MRRGNRRPQLAPYDFRGGRALVTGAAGGIGEALAHGLAARGSAMVLTDIDGGRLDAVVTSLRDRYPTLEIATYVVDLADADAVDRFATQVQTRYDDITLLINNAGVALGGTFDQLALEDVEWLLAINLHAVIRLTKDFLPMLQANPGSHIVNVSSVFGLIAPAGHTAYAASKFAVRGFSDALRQELDGTIGVTVAHPAGVRTGIAASARIPVGADPDEVAAERALWDRLLTMPAARAADDILEGARDRRSRVVVGATAMIPDLVSRMFPQAYQRMLDRGTKLLAALSPQDTDEPDFSYAAHHIPEDPGTARREIDGIGVRYRETGSPSAPPVLLIHGLTRSLADWTALHELLGHDYRVISFDLPGYGRTAPLDQPHTLRNLTAFVATALDAFGITEPVHLCGNSLGGAIALQLAVTHPERIRDLALLDSAGFGAEVGLALRVLGIRPLTPYLLRPSWRGSARVERALFYDKSLATPDRIAYSYALNHRPWAGRVLMETGSDLGDVRGAFPKWRQELLSQASALDVPVLVAWGLDDLILPATHVDAVHEHFPQARTHVFPRCGHLPMLEQPDQTADLLRDFWTHADAR